MCPNWQTRTHQCSCSHCLRLDDDDPARCRIRMISWRSCRFPEATPEGCRSATPQNIVRSTGHHRVLTRSPLLRGPHRACHLRHFPGVRHYHVYIGGDTDYVLVLSMAATIPTTAVPWSRITPLGFKSPYRSSTRETAPFIRSGWLRSPTSSQHLRT